MNGRKTKDRQIVVFGLGGFEPHTTFEEWPHHLTIMPWFLGAQQDRLFEGLRELSRKTAPITVGLGERAMFGARCDQPASQVDDAEKKVEALHLIVMNTVFRQARAEIEDLGWVGYKYSPHISDGVNGQVGVETITVDHLALVSDFSQQGEVSRYVREVFPLHG